MAFEERLEALAHSLELLAGMHLDAEKRNQERAEQFLEQQAAISARHDREMADLRREMADFHREMADFQRAFRRAVRLGVQEARNERKRRQKLDDKVAELAAAQVVTEQLFQAFLRRSGNGTH